MPDLPEPLSDPGCVLVDNPVTNQREIVVTGYDDGHDVIIMTMIMKMMMTADPVDNPVVVAVTGYEKVVFVCVKFYRM